jgi:hypothetical protein
MDHEQTSLNVRAVPFKADIRQRKWHVRYVPKADIPFIGTLNFACAARKAKMRDIRPA